jgi:hypothetical protein
MARLGRNLNQVEAMRVDAMLTDGSAIIRRYARESFTYVSEDQIQIDGDAGTITLPKIPVISVDAVLAVSGNPEIPNLLITWYFFDGIRTIMVPDPRVSGIINLAAWWYNTEWSLQPFVVTYTHGYNTVPSEVVAILCNAIISELSTPTMSATVQSEAIGAYSYSMRRNLRGATGAGQGAMAGIYAALMDFGMGEVLADYRTKAATIQTRR